MTTHLPLRLLLAAVGTFVAVNAQNAPTTLLDARKGYTTQLLPDPDAPPVPPKGIFSLVHYPSELGDLPAYLTPDPGDGKKHPAVLWCHGGFGGIDSYLWEPAEADNDQSAAAFREAGIVLMCPSVRGENNNPGRLELFYGEVDDIIAALAYLRKVPYVDPNRVYLAGHSTGGTLALLVSTAVGDLRASFSFGGAPNIGNVVVDGEGYGNTPYDYKSSKESVLRSAIFYTAAIKSPCFYFEGEDSFYTKDALLMQTIASRKNVPFRAFIVENGTHFNILRPLTIAIARKILLDTGEKCSITFTQREVQDLCNQTIRPDIEKD